jgi:hypothetical protein
MTRPFGLKLLVVAAIVFAIGSPAVQSLTGWGQSAAEFAADGDRTLRAAGYAFSIWGVIYAGLAAFGLYQLLPASRESRIVAALSLPAAVAIAACGAWIWASAFDREWLTVLFILVGAVAAVTAVVAGCRAGPASKAERWLALWPVAMLAGWLTIASALNILTVLTAKGYVDPVLATPAAIMGILAVVAAAFLVLRTSHVAVYGLPMAWGLAAVFVAERTDNAPAAWTAAAGAAVVLLFAASFGRPIAGRR